MNKQMLEICPTQSRVWIKRGAIMVDVREPQEVLQLGFDVDSLVNLPFRELWDRYRELPLNQELVLVCWNGSRSSQAAGFLHRNGYDLTRVVNLRQGIERWVSKGFPVKGDASILGDLTGKFTCGGKGNCC